MNCEYTFSFIVFFWIFPSRAAQKLNLSSKKKKHRPSTSSVAEPPLFATSFSGILQTSPPPAPPCLLRAVNKVKDTPGLGKVGTCAMCHAGSVCGALHQRQGREWGLGLFAKTRRCQGEKEKKWKSFGSTVKFSLVTYTSSKLRHSNYWRCGLILAERKQPCIVWQNCTQLKKRPHNTKDRGRGRRDQETRCRNKTWRCFVTSLAQFHCSSPSEKSQVLLLNQTTGGISGEHFLCAILAKKYNFELLELLRKRWGTLWWDVETPSRDLAQLCLG